MNTRNFANGQTVHIADTEENLRKYEDHGLPCILWSGVDNVHDLIYNDLIVACDDNDFFQEVTNAFRLVGKAVRGVKMATKTRPAILNLETLRGQVCNCARCGEDHDEIQWRPFTKSDKYTYWAMCPNLYEPILLTIEEDNG